MRSTILVAAAMAAVAFSAESSEAQTAPRSSAISVSRGEFAVTPYAGYMVSQRFFDGPLGTELSVPSAPLYGLQLSLPLAPSAAIVGSIAHASGDLDVGLPIIGGIDVGQSATTVFDASVELRLASAGRMVPLFQLGGGAIHRKVTVAGIDAKTTDFQVSGGIGADIPLAQNIALRLMAKDYWGKADFGSFAGLEAKTDDLHTVGLSGGVRIAF